jgi:hypothetical protein
MEVRKLRIANLPPEIQDTPVHAALSKYWEVRKIKEEKWIR